MLSYSVFSGCSGDDEPDCLSVSLMVHLGKGVMDVTGGEGDPVLPDPGAAARSSGEIFAEAAEAYGNTTKLDKWGKKVCFP